MRNIIGLDLNGWHDHAARDWRPYDGEVGANTEPTEIFPGSDSVYCLDGGVAAVVVEFGDGGHVAGPQAILSPIGRGPGWGSVGMPDRRRRIADLLGGLLRGEIDDLFKPQMRASVDAVSVSAEDVVLIIPDRREFDDERQDQLLKCLEGPRRPSIRLLWRPVAVALSMLESGRLPVVREGLRIVCLHHSDDGIERQELLLRQLPEHPGVFAPERAGYGKVVGRSAGLSTLLAECERQTAVINAHLEEARHELSRLPMRLLVEGVPPGTGEILRLDNGTWIEARAPTLTAPSCLRKALDIGPVDADVSLLTTPLAEPLRQEFIASVAAAIGSSRLVVAPCAAAAHGALLAGRRIEQDIPHYLDHLEQISLIAMKDGKLALVDLMPVGAAVPANREYVSEPIRSLSWPARVRNVDFYIRKSGEFRKWRTPDTKSPSENQQIEIRLRQMPAQGRAKLSATSSTWPTLRDNPAYLDWSDLIVETRALEEILLALHPPPKYPERIRAATHRDVWNGAQSFPTISQILRDFSTGQPSTLDALSAALRKKYRIRVSAPYTFPVVYEYFHALDFDGVPPDDAEPEAVARLDRALKETSDRILSDCFRKVPIQSNKLLILATWAHGRCPKPLQDEMLNAFAARLAGRRHPLLAPPQSEKVLVYGLGRSVSDPERMVALFDLIVPHLSRPFCLAALSSILSRTIIAPTVLTDRRVNLIADATASILTSLLAQRTLALNLKYALLVVGGLLRIRETDPYALLTARSDVAAKLARPLEGIHDVLDRHPRAFAKSTEKSKIVANLIAMLEGAGGDVGVLVETESLDVSDEEE
jgi:hypothetical protein